jgi:hypothetical protein
MTSAVPIGMPDDFAVVCENPSGAGMYIPALKALAASLSDRTSVSLLRRRGSRSILVGGDRRARLRILLGGRIASGDHHIRLTDSDTLMWWSHDGQEWSVRAAMPDGNLIPPRPGSVAMVEPIVALTIAAMERLTDPDQRARGDEVDRSLHAFAAAAAAQLPAGSRVACPAPPGPLGPEMGTRAQSRRGHDHISTPALD